MPFARPPSRVSHVACGVWRAQPRSRSPLRVFWPSPTLSPTDPVPRGLLTLWARAGMCVCIYRYGKGSSVLQVSHARMLWKHMLWGSLRKRRTHGKVSLPHMAPTLTSATRACHTHARTPQPQTTGPSKAGIFAHFCAGLDGSAGWEGIGSSHLARQVAPRVTFLMRASSMPRCGP